MQVQLLEVKQVFQTRHYIQCAALCERFLIGSNELHPIHKAYLNFYLALSHDTMAREAGMRNRHRALILAERHYQAAIAILAPSEIQNSDYMHALPSPTSSQSDEESNLRYSSDAASTTSEHSASSRATSVAEEHENVTEYKPTSKPSHFFHNSSLSGAFADGASSSPNLVKRKPNPLMAQHREEISQQQYLGSGVSSFVEMVKMHLAGVRELREASGAADYRYSFSRSRGSSVTSRPGSRENIHDDSEMDSVRRNRKSVSFRPRFDPTSVRQLCNQALAEL